MSKMRIGSSFHVIGRMVGTIIALALFDQITKSLAKAYLDPFYPIKLIPGHLHLTLVFNPGAAFGLMRSWPETLRMILFSIMYVIAFIILINMYRHKRSESKLVPVAISLIGGGALGNLIDRYRLGHVVDFIDTFPFGYDFPSFNFADSFITIGVSLMLIYLLFIEKEPADVP
ncbi:MAG: signal peptidase II [bacterium]